MAVQRKRSVKEHRKPARSRGRRARDSHTFSLLTTITRRPREELALEEEELPLPYDYSSRTILLLFVETKFRWNLAYWAQDTALTCIKVGRSYRFLYRYGNPDGVTDATYIPAMERRVVLSLRVGCVTFFIG